MNATIVTPAQGIAFAILILGWLTCDHFGLDDRLLEQAMAQPEAGESHVPR
ncbi:MAG: hypothetical protein QNK05_07085 [Myxococcota bacterium]|nr:hypothetical protein [Myxococcota bacterium]